jgi:hypothetical protein
MKLLPFFILIFVSVSFAQPKPNKIRRMVVTHTELTRRGLDFPDVKKVQYYNSDKIVFKHVLASTTTRIPGGTVSTVNGVTYETIVIPAHTPAILIRGSLDGDLYLKFDTASHENIAFHFLSVNRRLSYRY